MGEPKKYYDPVSEVVILLLFLVSISASVWGFYQTSIGQGCMDGLYAIYGVIATCVTGLLSLIITLGRFLKMRIAFRIMGFLPAVYVIGLILISIIMRFIVSFN
jgi:hypothetical protein